ncbi:MAG: Trypsin-like peptidase domain [Phormidium sp. OSCR]|nr:MAG: Trypsin-like peptidase domain [Phormidium sp. OSCR]
MEALTPQSEGFQTFKRSLARIFHSNGVVVGAGFAIAPGYLITCAHVVAAALSLAADTQDAPEQPVELEFPLAAEGERVTGQVVEWLSHEVDINSPSISRPADIAILKLDRTPERITPVTVGEGAWGHPFRILGFPKGLSPGGWASGVLRDQISNGWVLLEDIKAQGYSIQFGFSGAPVWDETINAVVGMAVQAQLPKKNQPDPKVAFMLPTSQLRTVWSRIPEIAGWHQPSGEMQSQESTMTGSDVRDSSTPPSNRRLRGLQARLKDVSGEIDIAEEQLAATNNDVERKRQERQLDILYKRHDEIEQQINNLKG